MQIKKLRKQTIIYGAITLAIMVFIFVQSAMPDYLSEEESNILVVFITNLLEKTGRTVSNEELISFLVRKAAHFTEYAILGASLFLTSYSLNRTVSALKGKRPWHEGILYLFSWLIGTIYAGTDELHQLFVPGRYGQFRDVLIDSAGLALGILITMIICRAKSQKVQKLGGANDLFTENE